MEVVRELAAARRERRATDVHWFDRLYNAYLTIIGCGMTVIVAITFVGTDEVSEATMRRVAADGRWVVAALCGLIVVVGARSGARGGPMTLEPPFVQHVLMSPVGRDDALLEPARRMLVNGALIGAGAGALLGLVAAERLPVSTAGLLACGAVAGAASTATAIGLAMSVAGRRLAMPAALAVAVPLGAVAGITGGRAALSAVDLDVVSIIAVVAIGAVLALVGLASIGGLSMESSIRRAGIVTGLRLAVTRQDLRAVVLLHRRLSLDRSRAEPWFPTPPAPWPVWRRGMQSIARLPAGRVVRMLVLVGVVVVACWGAKTGTVALIAVAALALHLLAVDLDEALAQETDHPTAWLAHARDPGRLLLLHLAAPATVLVVVAIPLALVAGEPVLALTAPAAAVVGGAASIVMPPFEPWANPFAPPESIGMRMILRVVWPIAVTGAGLAPLLAGADPVVLIATLVGIVGWWLSRRRPPTG